MLTLKQMFLLNENVSDATLGDYIDRSDFFLFFITHLKDFFEEKGSEFLILEPIFELDKEKNQSTTFAIDGFEVGQIYHLINYSNSDITLFYFNPEYKQKFLLLEEEQIEDVLIKDYVFWLNSIYKMSLFYKNHEDEKKS